MDEPRSPGGCGGHSLSAVRGRGHVASTRAPPAPRPAPSYVSPRRPQTAVRSARAASASRTAAASGPAASLSPAAAGHRLPVNRASSRLSTRLCPSSRSIPVIRPSPPWVRAIPVPPIGAMRRPPIRLRAIWATGSTSTAICPSRIRSGCCAPTPASAGLPAADQQRVVQQLHQVNQLTEEQRQRRLARAEIIEHLSPQERMQINLSARRWAELPPDRQAQMKSAFRDLRAVPARPAPDGAQLRPLPEPLHPGRARHPLRYAARRALPAGAIEQRIQS